MASVQPISSQLFSNRMQSFALSENTPIAIAVSGGADSMCLLRLLHIWCQQHQHPLIALTVDHGLRPEATQEAETVKHYCASLNIHHQTLTWNGTAPESNIQAKAREIRYHLLEQYCKQHHIHHLCLAHHKEDQAETALIRMMRGSGASGLAGMKYQTHFRTLEFLRPLLSHSKAEILATLNTFEQYFIEDPSNQDKRYMRVVVRDFLQQLERKDEVITHINKTTEHMQRLDDFMSSHLQQVEDDIVSVHPFGFSTVNKSQFFTLHPEIALRILSRQLLLISGNDTLPRFEEVERLYQSLISNTKTTATLAGCIIKIGQAKHNQHQLFIMRETKALPEDVPVSKEIIFDKRFACIWPSANTGNYVVGALGVNGWQSIKKHVQNNRLPKEVFYSLPALKHLEKVIAAPHIDFLADEKAANFSAHFLAS